MKIIALFLFDVNMNPTKTEILSVELNKKVDIELSDIDQILANVRYINGFYYLVSRVGLFRLNPDTGEVTKFNNASFLDVFEYKNKLYLSGVSDFEFYVSEDNGATFEQSEDPVAIRFVHVLNNNVFSQLDKGFAYEIANNDFSEVGKLSFNEAFIDDNSAYWAISYFYNQYYINIQKEIYYGCNLELVEE